MFKPVRILQVAAAVLLGGCASSHTAPPPSSQTPPAEQSAGRAASSTPSAPYPRRAGPRDTGPQAFADSQGRLKPDVQTYAHKVAAERGVPLGHVQALLEDARYDAKASQLMSPAKTTRIRRSWVTYRKRFVEPIRIRAGTEFWAQHRSTLDEAAKQYGVPPSVIVAIIGVETVYGRYTGSFSVLDAIATLAFHYPDPKRPERSQLFQDQLADLVVLDYRGVLDARRATGSFAGAMGLPQFMPGSVMRYAVDGDGDRQIDLAASSQDAIMSVANFLVEHGWQAGLPVFAPVALPADAQPLVHGGLEPVYDWEQLKTHGATSAAAASPGTSNNAWMRHKLGIVDLVDEPRNQVEYRSGTPNFFAITHYNRSYFYAASVADLAQELATRMGYGFPN